MQKVWIVFLASLLLCASGCEYNQTNTIPTKAQCDLCVSYIDVGQGDSEFIVLPNGETMLIDAGENQYGQSVVNYIKSQGYDKIDFLVATHPHADHIGGMVEVVNDLNVGSVYMSNATTTTKTFNNLLTSIKSKGLSVTVARAGMTIYDANGVRIDVLAPNGDKYEDLNNYSIVLKITYGNTSFLFMGDAGTLSEKEISSAEINTKSDVLKVGHHGSKTASSDEFIKRVSPKYAIISVGKDNDYGLPDEEVLNRLKDVGASILRTDKDGTIVIKSDGNDITRTTTVIKGSTISYSLLFM